MKKYFIFAAAVLTMTACSNDENENSVINDNAINLTASVAGATATRAGVAVQSTYFEADQLIRVEATPYNGETAGTMASAIYKTATVTPSTTINALSIPSGSEAIANNEALRWPAIGSLAFRAYYPSDVTSETVTFNVQVDQSTDVTNGDSNYKASDLMWGTTADAKVTKTTSAVGLTFTHALTKIIVKLTPGAGMTNDDIKDCVVTLHAKKTASIDKGVVTKTAGVYNATGDVATITMGKGEVTSTTEQSVNTYGVAAIIVPQDITIDSDPVDFITITTAGNHSVTYQLAASKTFDAGNVYTYEFEVGISGIILQSTQIIDWDGATTNTVNAGSLTL